MALLRQAALILSLFLVALYLFRGSVSRRRLGRWASNKHLLHVVAFGVLAFSYQEASWYRAQSVQRTLRHRPRFFIPIQESVGAESDRQPCLG